ncbi:MAG TPA: hypothetical protein VE650_17180, partial [Acetobacteraceae bacterium]|nr:hypothetical protein [Acetobacteraceae bacterium]
KAIDPATAEKPQLQFLTKANTLSRTAQQTEAALARRPPPQPAAQPAARPETQPAAAEPALHYMSNEEADALVNSVMASYLAKRQRAAGDAPPAQPALAQHAPAQHAAPAPAAR